MCLVRTTTSVDVWSVSERDLCSSAKLQTRLSHFLHFYLKNVSICLSLEPLRCLGVIAVDVVIRDGGWLFVIYLRKKIPSSFEFEEFVETHLYKLSVILRSRVLRVVCPH